jgi:hypothetical protein
MLVPSKAHVLRTASDARTIEGAMAAALLDPTRAGPGDPRFAVHRNNVVAGLGGALAATYPAVERLVGPDFFRAVATAFIRLHPPRSPVLLHWGGGFGDWLAGFAPVAGLPYLPDIARLEWARCEAYHATDARPATASLLSSLPPEALGGARLILHPSLRLVKSAYAVFNLWADVTGLRQGGIDPTRAEAVVIMRPDWEVETRLLPPETADFVARALGGQSLDALAGAATRGAFDLTEQLGAAFACGLIVDIAHEDRP